jgi:hypothetical protein
MLVEAIELTALNLSAPQVGLEAAADGASPKPRTINGSTAVINRGKSENVIPGSACIIRPNRGQNEADIWWDITFARGIVQSKGGGGPGEFRHNGRFRRPPGRLPPPPAALEASRALF